MAGSPRDFWKRVVKWFRQFWDLALLVFALGFILCTWLHSLETGKRRACIPIGRWREVCFPADPGGHIVALGSSTTPTGVDGEVTIYYLNESNVDSSDCSGSWTTNPAQSSLPSHYEQVDPAMVTPADATLDADTSPAAALGGFGWTVSQDGCYVVGFKEKLSNGTMASEHFSSPFWEATTDINQSVVACRQLNGKWKWVDGLRSCQ